MVDQAEIHRKARSEDRADRRWAVLQLHDNFEVLSDKEEAWSDLIRIISIHTDTEDINIQFMANNILASAFSNFHNKEHAWETIHQLTYNKNPYVRDHAAIILGSIFLHLIDKELAYQDLHRLTKDEDSNVRYCATTSLGESFFYLPNKIEAWKDLHRLTKDKYNEVLWRVAAAIGAIFSHIPDKEQAWNDLHRLTLHKDVGVRWEAAYSIGEIFQYISNKKEAWCDLNRLAKEDNSGVCQPANYSLGRASIFNAGDSISREDFKNDLKNALIFFRKSNDNFSEFYSSDFRFADFCLPFYRSFYTMIFKKEDASEVEKYLSEAKSAIEGSDSKEQLLEAVENLGNALKEVQKARDFNDLKSDLNAYRRYCDRACELLDTTEDKAPGASRLIRKGLPIIDERIKGIIAEIQEKAKTLFRNTRDTPFENLGKDVNRAGQCLAQIRDPISLEKRVQNLQTALSAICARMAVEERGDACELLRKVNDEQYVEDKLELINMVLSKIPSQMSVMKRIDVNITGSGNRTYIDSTDNSLNINTDLAIGLENLAGLLERDYKKEDRREVLKTIEQMRTSCSDPSKKTWLKEKLGWIITKTSEIATISSFAITLKQML